MSHQTDLLEQVIAELGRRRGELVRIARESALPYDTVLRIKNRESDPGYSKVRALAECLFGPDPATGVTPAVPAAQEAA